jgi:hypothetical protein
MKLLFERVLMDRKDDKDKVLLQLDEIQAQLRLQDLKMNLLAKKLMRLDLSTITLANTQTTPSEGQTSTKF